MRKTTAIIMASGIGSRFLPAAKAMNKCLLPLGNKPTIQYLVEECLHAGITDVIIVVASDDTSIQNHFSRNSFLENRLRHHNKQSIIDDILRPINEMGTHIRFIAKDTQDKVGTALPVQVALKHIDDSVEQLVILNGDAIIYRDPDIIGELRHALDRRSDDAEGIIFGFTVPLEEREHYGALIAQDTSPDILQSIVEKPPATLSPQSLTCNLGWYVAPRSIEEHVRAVVADPDSGECRITDAFNAHMQTTPYRIHAIEGERYLDCGRPETWLAANNYIASKVSL